MRWVSRPVPNPCGHTDCVAIDGEHNDVDEVSSGPLMRKKYSLERRWMLGAVLRDRDSICGSSEELVWLKLKNGNVVAARVSDVLHANHSADVRSCMDLATLKHLHLPAATRALQEASAQGTRAIFAGDTLVYLANNETCGSKEGKGLLSTLERSGPILEYADAVRMTMHTKQENQIILVTGPAGTGKTKAADELARALMTGNSCLRRGTTAACRVMQAFTSSMDAQGSLRSRALVTAEISYASTGGSLSRAPCASQVSAVFFEPWRATTCIPEKSLAVLRLMSTSLDADSCARLGLEPSSQRSLDATSQKESDLMAHLMEDMETAGLDVADRLHIFSTLAAVLHLGKLSFIQRSDGRVVVAAPRRGLRGRTRPRSTGSTFLLRRSTSSSSFKGRAPMQEDKGKVSPGIPMSGPSKAPHASLLPLATTTTTTTTTSAATTSGSGGVNFGSSGPSKVHSESAKAQMSSILLLKRHSRSSRGPWTENLPPQRKVTQNGHALVLRESEPILRRHGSGPLRRRPTGLGGHQSAEDVLVAGGERRLSALGQLQGTRLEKAAFLLGLETSVLENALCEGTKDPATGEHKARALAKSVFWGVLRWVEQRVNEKLGELEPLTNGTRSVTIVDCLPAAADREHGGIDESRPFENTLADAVGVAIEHDIFDHAVLGKTTHGTSYSMEVLFGSIAGGGLLARLEDEFADAANYRGHTGHGERLSASSSREAEHEVMSRTASMSMSSASTEASSSSTSSLLGLHRQEDFLDHVEFQEHRIPGPENEYVAAHEGDFAEKNQLGHWQSLLAKSVQQFTKELPLPERSQVVTLYRRDVGRLVSWLMDYGVNVHFVRCIRAEDSNLAATEAPFMKRKSSAFEVGSCCMQSVMKQVADSKLVEVARKHRAGRFLHSVSVQSILQPYRAHLPLADLRRDSQTVVEGILYALGMDKAFIQIGPKDATYSCRSIHTVQSLLRPSEEQLAQMRAARIRASWRSCLAVARACSHFSTMFKASRQRSEAATTINRLARRVARSEIILRRVQAAKVIQRSLRRFRACKHARAHLNELRTFARVKAAKRAIRVRARETALFLRRRSSSSGSISQ